MMVAVSLPLLCINFYFNTQTKLGSSDPVETIASRATAHSSSNDSSDIVDLQLLTAANITADGLFIHICFEYVVTGLVLAFSRFWGLGVLLADDCQSVSIQASIKS